MQAMLSKNSLECENIIGLAFVTKLYEVDTFILLLTHAKAE